MTFKTGFGRRFPELGDRASDDRPTFGRSFRRLSRRDCSLHNLGTVRELTGQRRSRSQAQPATGDSLVSLGVVTRLAVGGRGER